MAAIVQLPEWEGGTVVRACMEEIDLARTAKHKQLVENQAVFVLGGHCTVAGKRMIGVYAATVIRLKPRCTVRYSDGAESDVSVCWVLPDAATWHSCRLRPSSKLRLFPSQQNPSHKQQQKLCASWLCPILIGKSIVSTFKIANSRM
eukprot:TRINITY_DN9483_c0_g1_i5.p1 TRINITY_DN9483_c0_g1~~TRINITY_DN9483_c0_g1_i5.p1  ORF type:complete len:147 (-),score=10.49 TRINITY_DN9483_c0_g1_i5:286-726(-)